MSHAGLALPSIASLSINSMVAVLLALFVALPAPISAQSVSVPMDPLNPTDYAQCEDLRQRYRAIEYGLRDEARRIGDACVENRRGRIASIAEVQACHAPARRAYLRANVVLHQSNAAVRRCHDRVRAHELRQRESMPNTSGLISGLPERVGRTVFDGALDAGLEGLSVSRNPTVSAAAKSYSRVSRAATRLAALTSTQRLMTALRERAIGGVTANPLSQMITGLTVELTLEIHQAAMDDLNLALERLEAQRTQYNYARAMERHDLAVARALQGRQETAHLGPDIYFELGGRFGRAEQAARSALETRRAETARLAPAPSTPSSGGGRVVTPSSNSTVAICRRLDRELDTAFSGATMAEYNRYDCNCVLHPSTATCG